MDYIEELKKRLADHAGIQHDDNLDVYTWSSSLSPKTRKMIDLSRYYVHEMEGFGMSNHGAFVAIDEMRQAACVTELALEDAYDTIKALTKEIDDLGVMLSSSEINFLNIELVPDEEINFKLAEAAREDSDNEENDSVVH